MSDDNIIHIDFPTKIDLDPDLVLEGARGELKEVLILGWDRSNDSGRLYIAGSDADASRALILLMLAQKRILEMSDEAGRR